MFFMQIFTVFHILFYILYGFLYINKDFIAFMRGMSLHVGSYLICFHLLYAL